ncbi:MAG: hypothetical protein JKY96_05340 [Phycisphaerales bacterium]|nr:hypothetical protein [Phycisphaerales bacterium]
MKKPLKIILIVFAVIVLFVGSVAGWAYYEFLYTTPLTQAEVAELEVDWTPVTGGNWSPWVTAGDGTQEWNPAKSFNDWLATVPEEDKAWVVIADLWYGKHGPIQNGLFSNEYLGWLPPNRAQWARLMPMLETAEAEEVFLQLDEAYQRPVMGRACTVRLDRSSTKQWFEMGKTSTAIGIRVKPKPVTCG